MKDLSKKDLTYIRSKIDDVTKRLEKKTLEDSELFRINSINEVLDDINVVDKLSNASDEDLKNSSHILVTVDIPDDVYNLDIFLPKGTTRDTITVNDLVHLITKMRTNGTEQSVLSEMSTISMEYRSTNAHTNLIYDSIYAYSLNDKEHSSMTRDITSNNYIHLLNRLYNYSHMMRPGTQVALLGGGERKKLYIFVKLPSSKTLLSTYSRWTSLEELYTTLYGFKNVIIGKTQGYIKPRTGSKLAALAELDIIHSQEEVNLLPVIGTHTLEHIHRALSHSLWQNLTDSDNSSTEDMAKYTIEPLTKDRMLELVLDDIGNELKELSISKDEIAAGYNNIFRDYVKIIDENMCTICDPNKSDIEDSPGTRMFPDIARTNVRVYDHVSFLNVYNPHRIKELLLEVVPSLSKLDKSLDEGGSFADNSFIVVYPEENYICNDPEASLDITRRVVPTIPSAIGEGTSHLIDVYKHAYFLIKGDKQKHVTTANMLYGPDCVLENFVCDLSIRGTSRRWINRKIDMYLRQYNPLNMGVAPGLSSHSYSPALIIKRLMRQRGDQITNLPDSPRPYTVYTHMGAGIVKNEDTHFYMMELGNSIVYTDIDIRIHMNTIALTPFEKYNIHRSYVRHIMLVSKASYDRIKYTAVAANKNIITLESVPEHVLIRGIIENFSMDDTTITITADPSIKLKEISSIGQVLNNTMSKNNVMEEIYQIISAATSIICLGCHKNKKDLKKYITEEKYSSGDELDEPRIRLLGLILDKMKNNHLIIDRDMLKIAEEIVFTREKLTNTEDKDMNPDDALKDMIGLESVKKEVQNIINYISRRDIRKLSSTHMVFTGNPGTGKTTVARIIAEVFKKHNVFQHSLTHDSNGGVMIEALRADLVGAYVGHTALKTKEKIRDAMGKVLFIDEAQELYNESERDFGKEAIGTLVPEMENNRHHMCVILAGYKKEMNDLLNKGNPGLKSRIKWIIDFPDYTTPELIEIFRYTVDKAEYTYDEACISILEKYLNVICDNKGDNFDNARMIRRMFELLQLIEANDMDENHKECHIEPHYIKTMFKENKNMLPKVYDPTGNLKKLLEGEVS